MTLNGLMAIILPYFTKFSSLGANYVTMVKVRLIVYAPKM